MKGALAGGLLLLALGCAAREPLVAAHGGRQAMGTVLEITLYGRDPTALRATLEALFDRAGRLDAMLSVHDPASDLSWLNRRAGRGPRRVAPELGRLLALSVGFAEHTSGSFDVTVGPLLELWTRAAERGEVPSAAEIAAARERVGARGIEFRGDGRVALAPGVAVVLDGVAKGYAVDRMRELLRARGVSSALVNFGRSSTLALGAPPGSPGWRLLARGPDEEPLGILTLRDRALAVSGSLAQGVRIGGRRFGHVLDPRSGWPLERRRQAYVVAPSAALAEALAKGLLIGGAGEGLPQVEALGGCEGLLVEAGGGRFESSGWRAAVGFEPLARSGASSGALPAPIQLPWPAASSPAPSARPTFRSAGTSAPARSSSAATADRPSA